MAKHRIGIAAILTIALIAGVIPANGQNVISLDGDWDFSFKENSFDRKIHLPGTTDQAGYGKPSPAPDIDNQWTFGWRRPVIYEGKAWYRTTVDIPSDWAGRHIELFLEQTRSETTVYVDGVQAGDTEMSLLTSHRHDLSAALTPGRHSITLLLDNGNKHGIGGSYVRSAMGQGNWQGITGHIELRTTPPFWIKGTVFTPLDESVARVEIRTETLPGKAPAERYQVQILDGKNVVRHARGNKAVLEVSIAGLGRWDEFNPKCYILRTIISRGTETDIREETIGIRFVGMNSRRQFTVNGRPIFLRGTVSYNIFPITGYPSTDQEDWEKTFLVYKEWGMNHVRFHSLTPPEAALHAADKIGIYLQCEAPKAGRCGQNAEDDAFHIAEGRRILADYGNHPSFILMSMGNELAGEIRDIQHIYDEVTSGDHRRLYTTTTGNSKQELCDDYKIYGGIVRGFKGPFTDWDYRTTAQGIGQTMLSHEVGQWHTYPDMRQIAKYTGVMKCDNLVLIRDDLARRGLLDRAEEFTQTTGRFAALLYKDEMEAIERTPDYGGFQILTLNDFPAQGTASSGMIDIFNDPKGYLTAEEFREYCAPVVPLLRLPARCFANTDTIEAGLDLSCYLPDDLRDVCLDWELRDDSTVYAGGSVQCGTVSTGNVHHAGHISIPLSSINEAKALQIVVKVAGTPFRNRWNVWVYPKAKAAAVPPGIKVVNNWPDARAALENGGRVLFFPIADDVAKWRPGQFKTVFWSPVWLKRGIETMSVAADTKHAALKGFPTEHHTDWQWFNVLENSFTLCIDDLPSGFKPVVGMIDSYRKNQRLANMLEARVGKGRLLLTTLDVMRNLDRDVERCALHNSIISYMESDAFVPSQELSFDALEGLFHKRIQRLQEVDLGGAKLDISADGKSSRKGAGYDLHVESKTQKSGDVTAWADKRDLNFKVSVPRGVEGELYLFLRNSKSSRWGMLKTPQEIAEVDWVEETFENYGNKQPVAGLFVDGEYYGTLNKFGDTGSWYAIPIGSDVSGDSAVNVQICTFNFPNILTRLAFKPRP